MKFFGIFFSRQGNGNPRLDSAEARNQTLEKRQRRQEEQLQELTERMAVVRQIRDTMQGRGPGGSP